MLGRKSRARSTSWPEAKASLRGRIHCRRPILVIWTFCLQSGGGPYIAWGKESAPRRGASRILGNRACVRRAGLHGARHAERQTERQTGRSLLVQLISHGTHRADQNNDVVFRTQRKDNKASHRTEVLPHGPISRLRHGSPDVGSTFRRTGIAGKVDRVVENYAAPALIPR